ncbi:MspA family porin [Corynebacterium pelargi]|uniref:MspA n=1 Tax=Corynebacterium pelargi TaxID=1471400 RepID=A0A410WBU9_9CORY|nr:MspA family porin [Corynebacterium pelargi]QAU53404.1 MspA [Corynebacterium pelargi]QAU53406.1 MspA [Corynebacterium pelargi]
MRSAPLAGLIVGVGLALSVGSAAALPGWVPVLEGLYPLPVAGGERDLRDAEASRVTADGWVLHAQKVDESIHFAPALDGGVTTGEAFGTLSGRTWIDGDGSEAIQAAYFETGYQIGCGVDVSRGADVEVASVLGVSPSVGVAPSANAGVDGGVKVGPSVQVTLPDNSATLGADATADAGAKAGVGVDSEAKVDSKAEVAPTIAFHLDPGGITNIPLAGYSMNLDKLRAAGGFTGAHLQINGCAGPVSIRSYVSVTASTDTSVDAVAVYGDARRIR